MGHVQRRSNGRWLTRYRTPDGRELSKMFNRKLDADRFLSRIEADKTRGEWLDPQLGKISLDDWAAEWMAHTIHLKPKTRAGYESLYRTHIRPPVGSTQLVRIQPIAVREWVHDLSDSGLSPSRVRQAYRVLSALMKAAVETGMIARTPCIGVRLPRDRRREAHFLSADQVEALANAVDPHYRTLIYLLAYGGLRWGEAMALRRKHCLLLEHRIQVTESMAEVGSQIYYGSTKTSVTRWVYLPDFLCQELALMLAKNSAADPDGLVFLTPDDSVIRGSNFRRRVWLPALKKAGLTSVRIHDLRHTCASLLIAQGAHPKAIQGHLGHSSITMTFDRYGHLFPSDMEKLAAGLDETFRGAVA